MESLRLWRPAICWPHPSPRLRFSSLAVEWRPCACGGQPSAGPTPPLGCDGSRGGLLWWMCQFASGIVRSWLGGSGAAGNSRPTDCVGSYDTVRRENCVFFVFLLTWQLGHTMTVCTPPPAVRVTELVPGETLPFRQRRTAEGAAERRSTLTSNGDCRCHSQRNLTASPAERRSKLREITE